MFIPLIDITVIIIKTYIYICKDHYLWKGIF